MFNKKKFAKRLKALRIEKNLTMEEVASAIGLAGKSAIGKYEGGYSLPSLDVLVLLSDFFTVTTDYLLGSSDLPHSLLNNPEGNLNYQFLTADGISNGTLKYSFGIFPLEHHTFYFLFLEEAEGQWLNKVLTSNGQLEFLTLIGLLNDRLNLGYTLDKGSNGIHPINLIMQKAAISRLDPIHYHELKSGTGSPVVFSDIFSGYEKFIDSYLSLSELHKKEFINNWFHNSSEEKNETDTALYHNSKFSLDEFKKKFLPSMPISKIIEELLGKR